MISSLMIGLAEGRDVSGYEVDVKPSGDDALDPLVTASSLLISLQKAKYPGDFAFIARLRSDYRNISEALQSRGYYDGQVIITVSLADKAPIDAKDPHLFDYLRAAGQESQRHIRISVVKGDVFKIGTIGFYLPLPPEKGEAGKAEGPAAEGVAWGQPMTLPQDAQARFGLKPGQPAIAEDVLAAQGRLLHGLLETGHAQARVDAPIAMVDKSAKTLNLKLTVYEGPIVAIGPITFAGMKRTRLSFLKNRLQLHEGELYRPSKIEAARQDIVDTGIFSYVGAKNEPPLVTLARPQHGLQQAMPVVIKLQESKARNIAGQAGYSTDLGGRAGVDWTHRNLFGGAERLKVTALMTGLGGSAQQGLGYDFYTDLLKPDFLRRQQNLSLRVEGVKQLLYSYHQTALIIRGGISRNLSRYWNIGASLSVEQEKIRQFGAVNDYFIASIPLSATYDSTEVSNPIEPATHGIRANITVTPSESFEHGNSFFTIMSASISHYFDLHRLGLTKPGRSIIAIRGIVGSVQGASVFQIPPDQRLYAGGPATVRGFRYQGIGPQQGKYAVGGTSLDAGTVEFRQRVMQKFGVAAFVDAGQVGEGSRPFQGTVRVGYGAGVRYYTPIGPVRLDFALPMNRPRNGDKWEFYVGLGETF
ncbi:BamA/TamA family outer membrane protein [Candidatus Kirkpatrickella diaphorinae]|uniref:BamA/TamA family outer membrane protein n=1 Tax=Candidatus Kirkpatrickella diaphorinae TaxID=2984322 RepID=A0ABY6GKH4_9PROT|nr:BamA/TamA family outer membrane protein [Candidatus Kirkpatrickella diaphorinae]UYH52040.1 BamA/TamA family outer membrane protein [Candidatus Kirkpatrickella diaphorinae]